MPKTSPALPRSAVVWGSVSHCRMAPKRHAFSYPMMTLELDVDELETGTINSLLFGYGRVRFLSIRNDDYLRGVGSLRHKVEELVRGQGVQEQLARITLVTMPRVFGYIFNPVSFFICFNQQDKLIACITQVHNTFGDAHVYPLVCQPSALPVEWRFSKAFFVSPFFDLEGEYRVLVEEEGKNLAVVVDLFKSGQQVFGSKLSGTAIPLTTANMAKTLLRFPLTCILTMPRIHIQAIILMVWTRLVPFVRPSPTSTYTIRSQQNRIHRARLWLLSTVRAIRLRLG